MPKVSGTPSPTTKATTSPHILFVTTIKPRCALHLNDYTDQEWADCWFSDEDLKNYVVDVKQTVALISSVDCGNGPLVNFPVQPSICRRGVEHWTSEGSKKQIQNKICVEWCFV